MSMPPPPGGPQEPVGPPPGWQQGPPPGWQQGPPPGWQQGPPQGGLPYPADYQPYGLPPAQPNNSSMAVAGFVLSLVGLIPCFWFFQVPGLLGTIFGFVGLGQTKEGRQRGRGMAIAAVVVGILLVAACVAFWVLIAMDDDHCIHWGTGPNVCDD